MLPRQASRRVFASVFFGCFIVHSMANAVEEKPRSFESCASERAKFCTEKVDAATLRSCLFEHRSELSTTCKQELERFLQYKNEAASRGGGALSSFGGLNSAGGPPIPLVSYEGRYSPGVGNTSVLEDKFGLSLPIFRTSSDSAAISLAAGNLHFQTPLNLSSGTIVPGDLDRLEIGAQYFHQLEGHRNWGIRASLGYAGDQPFQSPYGTTYSAGINYGFPGTGGFWILAAFFSNNSPFGNNVPFPGVDYLFKSETLTALVGIPATSLQWTPVYPWAFSFSFFGPAVQSELAYGDLDRWQFFFQYNWVIQSYIPTVITDPGDRLYFSEMKIAPGFRWLLGSSMMSEVQLGQSFDRSVYIGSRLLNYEGGWASLSPDWFVSWSVKAKF